jgi:hypothetical protein
VASIADRNGVSQRTRILAAAAFVAFLALGGGLLLLTRGQGSGNAAVPVIKPLHPAKKHAKSLSKAPAKRARKAKKARTPAVIDGMPGVLAVALRRNPVVVVALYSPKSSVDGVAREEARQGAALSGAGFVALDVSDNKVAAPLTALLTGAATAADRVLDDPAVLIFQQPKTLFVRFNGFTDRDTVAQAAINAGAVKLTTVGSTVAWAGQANGICNKLKADLLRLPLPTSGESALDWVDSLNGVLDNTVKSLRALTPPKGHEAQVRQMVALYSEAVSASEALVSSVRAGKNPDLAAFQQRITTLGHRADAIAVDLGATACGS